MDATKRKYLWDEETREAWRESVAPELRLRRYSDRGSRNSSGTAGARGRLTHVSETLDRVLTDASITPGVGWNTFQGQLSDILLPSSGDGAGVAILMVSFDSRTLQRLREALCGDLGMTATDAVRCSRMIVSVEPPTT